jgi:TRAP-type C4-dicarboxylate transport system substrate-binding protein
MKFVMWKLLVLLLISTQVEAVTLKVALLAPDGTTWADNVKDMAKEIQEKSKGKVKFKIYLGGVQGDEPDVLRKVRINQLHGGIFTGRAIGDINGDVRIMEVPFSFEGNRAGAFKTLEKMTGHFNKGFEKNNFVNLGFFEIGNVYLVSTKPANSLDALKGVKIWAWTGDEIVAAFVKELNLVSVPLALPDVLSSLSTGIIEAAYSSPLGILALQWNTKVKYLIDYPLAYSVAAFLISKKKWDKIPADQKKLIQTVANKYTKKANAGTIIENKDAKEALKSLGIQFLTLNEKDLSKRNEIRKNLIEKLSGKVFSKETVKLFNAAKAESIK